MKNKIVYNYIGKVLICFAILFIFPIIVCLVYSESIIPFLLPQIFSLLLGLILNSINIENDNIYAKEGFKIVALSWIIISFIGAFPLYISGSANFIDSFFEIVAGFTTSGASIFKDVEVLSKGILFWRSFSHFIGGMGVLVFVMAIVPLSHNDKSMHVLKAEMPGPTIAKLVPSIRKTLLYLYIIYAGLTISEFAFLLLSDVGIFESILIALGTAGTGGFAPLNTSLATYAVSTKIIVTIYMFLFGINFNLYFLMIIGEVKNVLKSEELKIYILMIIVSVAFIFINTVNLFANAGEALLQTVFHVISFTTSTGYSIGDVNIYPTSCKILVLMLMLISACAGSTCGGFKISRLIITLKSVKRELNKLVHPNSVQSITFEGKKVPEDTIKSTNSFMILYALILILIIFIVSFDGYSLETTINAVFTTFANVGLCFNISCFADFSVLSKLVLSIGMLFGRLEIFPMIVLLTDWKKE